MQSKSTRGVQQEEVWAAADALIAVGLRPTIERVRQQLGRGSPNTVSPMLEVWFGGLGKRLGMTDHKAEEGQMPPAVVQAMNKLWDAALLTAREEVDATLAEEKQSLAREHAALTQRESDLDRQQQALAQRQAVTDELLREAREKTTSVQASLKVTQEQLRQRDDATDDLRKVLGSAQDQLLNTRNQSDAQARHHSEERRKLEERSAGNERRLLGEIERERQSARQDSAKLTDANTLLQTMRVTLEARLDDQAQGLLASRVELGTARQALASTELRCTELSALLQEQRTANAFTLDRLNQTLAAMTRKSAPAKRNINLRGSRSG